MQLLEGLAARRGSTPTLLPCALTPDIGGRLRDLGSTGRQRLAQVPCLLIDGGFDDAARWFDAKHDLDEDIVTGAAGGWSAAAAGRVLARSTLHLAWYWARVHSDAVPLVLGASRACAAMIATFSLSTLNALADTYCAWFRPRWEDQARVWRSLVGIAQREPTSPLFLADATSSRLLRELTGELN